MISISVKRISGKSGKWISVSKGLPDNNYTVLVYMIFPNKTTMFGLAKLIQDSWKVIALAQMLDLDLSNRDIQNDLNRHIKFWQKIDEPM